MRSYWSRSSSLPCQLPVEYAAVAVRKSVAGSATHRVERDKSHRFLPFTSTGKSGTFKQMRIGVTREPPASGADRAAIGGRARIRACRITLGATGTISTLRGFGVSLGEVDAPWRVRRSDRQRRELSVPLLWIRRGGMRNSARRNGRHGWGRAQAPRGGHRKPTRLRRVTPGGSMVKNKRRRAQPAGGLTWLSSGV
jgi:hypothetical protein